LVNSFQQEDHQKKWAERGVRDEVENGKENRPAAMRGRKQKTDLSKKNKNPCRTRVTDKKEIKLDESTKRESRGKFQKDAREASTEINKRRGRTIEAWKQGAKKGKQKPTGGAVRTTTKSGTNWNWTANERAYKKEIEPGTSK